MNNFASVLIGALTGIFFYYGLWFTIRALPSTRHPVLLTLSSFWLRTLVSLGAFVFAMHGRWQNGIALLAGFALGRLAVSWLIPRRSKRCM